MRTHNVEARIEAPKEAVWSALSDIGGIWKYNPSVTKSYSVSEANHGVGAARHCDLVFSGASVEERVVEWDDSGSYTIEIFDGEKLPPIRNILAHLAVREDGDGSIVTASLVYDTRFGPLGRVIDKLMVSPKFGRAFAGIVAGLKHHLETGETVGEETELPYDMVAYTAV